MGVKRDGAAGGPDHLRLVIADDDDAVRICLRTVLELDDFVIVGEATNGREAVARAIESRPDVIILDQRMPQMTGEQAAGLIRGALPDVKILAFSAVLESTPPWADQFVDKTEINALSELIHSYESYAV